MKNALLPLVAVFFCSVVFADDGTTTATPPSSSVVGHGHHVSKRFRPSSVSGGSGTIHGTCAISESAMNPLPGPCVNLLLILNDTSGNEVEKTRTTPQGQFEFTAKSGGVYRIASGSRFYQVTVPKDVHGGDKIELILKQEQ